MLGWGRGRRAVTPICDILGGGNTSHTLLSTAARVHRNHVNAFDRSRVALQSWYAYAAFERRDTINYSALCVVWARKKRCTQHALLRPLDAAYEVRRIFGAGARTHSGSDRPSRTPNLFWKEWVLCRFLCSTPIPCFVTVPGGAIGHGVC